MAEIVLHIWCEDRGHESVAKSLVRRIAAELGIERLHVETQNGEGGLPRVASEFKAWQRAVQRGKLGGIPDILVLVVDANSEGHAGRRASLGQMVVDGLFPRVVFGCPEPHVEAWLLLDPVAFKTVTGRAPVAPSPRPGEDHKGLFHASVAESGVHVLTGPMELAPDIVDAMNLERVSLIDRSLGSFLDELRAALRLARS